MFRASCRSLLVLSIASISWGFCGPAASALGADIVVAPGQSIQAAIDLAIPGDRILVLPGVYREAIDFQSKALEVRGVSGPKVTTIDAAGLGQRVATIDGGQVNAILAGFTLTNGTSVRGGGAYIGAAIARIEDCVIRGNSATDGGGVAVDQIQPWEQNHPFLRDCLLESNAASGSGGGLLLGSPAESVPRVERCRFVDNSATDGAGVAIEAKRCTFIDSDFVGNVATGRGGGIAAFCPKFDVYRCVLDSNQAATGGGVFWERPSTTDVSVVPIELTMLLRNRASVRGGAIHATFGVAPFWRIGLLDLERCTLALNSAPSFGAIDYVPLDPAAFVTIEHSIAWANGPNAFTPDPTLLISASDVEGGFPGPGNIAIDPAFVDLAGGDLHLTAGSPCVDSLGPIVLANQIDFEGDPFATKEDMGADEFHRHAYVTSDFTAGSPIELTCIGPPGDPVLLFLGPGLAPAPVPIPPHGDYLLALPLFFNAPIPLPPIGAAGFLSLAGTVRASTAGMTAALQCAIGAKLTNAELLEF